MDVQNGLMSMLEKSNVPSPVPDSIKLDVEFLIESLMKKVDRQANCRCYNCL